MHPRFLPSNVAAGLLAAAIPHAAPAMAAKLGRMWKKEFRQQ